MRKRLRAQVAVRRGTLRWWLVYGPVRSGTTLMANLIADHARWEVSDWGLHAALLGPLGHERSGFDPTRPRRALLTAVLAATDSGHGGVVDLVYKQANIRADEVAVLEGVLGPAERRIFCLRDPAGFMASAVRKFPDVDHANLQEINYVGTIAEHARIGGEVFLYHPEVQGRDYASFLRPLEIAGDQLAQVRYSGRDAKELTTDAMWDVFHRLAAAAANHV